MLDFLNQLDEEKYKNELTEIGNQFISDIQNNTEETYIDYNMLKTYFVTSILPGLDQELSSTEIITTTTNVLQQYREGYHDKIQKIKSIVDQSGINPDDLTLYTALPLNFNSFKTPDEKYINQYVALFLIGDGDKMLMILSSVIDYNYQKRILEIDEPDTYIDFSEGDYVLLYHRFYQILEKIIQNSQSNGQNTLFGEKVNEEWNKCSIQIFEEIGLTYVKSMVYEDNVLMMDREFPNIVFFRMLSEVNYNQAYNLMLEMVSIMGQGFYITASAENGLAQDVYLKSFSREVISEDQNAGTTSAVFSLINEASNSELCSIKFEIVETDNEKASLDIWIIQEK